MPEICESFSQRRPPLYHLSQGTVVIFAGGTGNPFFTTDSAAALRAAEIGADAIFKGTQVDGVYSADPKKVPDRHPLRATSTHDEVLGQGPRRHGRRGGCACARNHIPIIVFSIHEKGGFAKILTRRRPQDHRHGQLTGETAADARAFCRDGSQEL